jgi:hypothetical protein
MHVQFTLVDSGMLSKLRDYGLLDASGTGKNSEK